LESLRQANVGLHISGVQVDGIAGSCFHSVSSDKTSKRSLRQTRTTKMFDFSFM
jgi:hypothetical protein